MTISSPPPHLVLVVFRDAGHIGPSMVLAKSLAALGVRLTLLFPEWDGYTRAKAEPGLFQISTLKPLVEEGGHLDHGPGAKPAALEAALVEMKQQEEPPTAVLVDMIYVHWSKEPISKAGLPRYLFYTSGGTSLAFMLELHGPLPPPPESGNEIGAANGQIDDAHHSNGVGNGGDGNGVHSDVQDVHSNGVGDGDSGNGHLHSNGHRHSDGGGRGRGRGRGRGGRGGHGGPGHHHQEYLQSLRSSAGILVNTAYELEAKEIDLIRPVLNVYPVGPLFSFDPESPPTRDSSSDECLQWLDSQPPRSVAFVSFGSRTYLSAEQIRELATGLEASGQGFLWVLPTPPEQPSLVDDSLPDGFLERVAGRGYLLRGWAPQLAILAHPSTGGFVTHCGWNSVAETICLAAQPMLCWPFDADQPTNANFLVDDAQVALRVSTGGGGGPGRKGPRSVVRHDEIERQVRALVAGPETADMRKRLAAMRAATLDAIKPKGSSQANLAKFVEDLESSRNML